MRVLGEVNPQGLPRPIPADELQVMLGPNEEFCSQDASISQVSEKMARWPFLLSRHQEPTGHKAKEHPPLPSGLIVYRGLFLVGLRARLWSREP
jgi:hypothetical protein